MTLWIVSTLLSIYVLADLVGHIREPRRPQVFITAEGWWAPRGGTQRHERVRLPAGSYAITDIGRPPFPLWMQFWPDQPDWYEFEVEVRWADRRGRHSPG